MSVIYPVGFMAGIFQPAGDAEQSCIRVGRHLHSIGIVDLELWTAAHGPVPQQGASWRVTDVLAAYRTDLAARDVIEGGSLPSSADVDDVVAGSAFDRLLRASLLVEVADADRDESDEPGSAMTHRRFADTHRFRGLLSGLGQSSDDPALEIVGTESSTVAVISQSLYGLWLLAGQADSLRVAAEQIIAEAAALGDAITLQECLARLLPDLRGLVSQGLGYFDAVPRNEGPLQYLAFEQIPNSLAAMEDMRAAAGDRLLDEDEYRSRLSGAPEGLRYLVEDPTTGKEVGYAGFASETLFDTIASMDGRTPERMVAQARRQLSAAGKYPLVWHVQQPDDVAGVRQILQDAGITEVEVRYTSGS